VVQKTLDSPMSPDGFKLLAWLVYPMFTLGKGFVIWHLVKSRFARYFALLWIGDTIAYYPKYYLTLHSELGQVYPEVLAGFVAAVLLVHLFILIVRLEWKELKGHSSKDIIKQLKGALGEPKFVYLLLLLLKYIGFVIPDDTPFDLESIMSQLSPGASEGAVVVLIGVFVVCFVAAFYLLGAVLVWKSETRKWAAYGAVVYCVFSIRNSVESLSLLTSGIQVAMEIGSIAILGCLGWLVLSRALERGKLRLLCSVVVFVTLGCGRAISYQFSGLRREGEKSKRKQGMSHQ